MKFVANTLALLGSITLFTVASSPAQVLFTGAYIEDFNTLPTTGNLTGGYAAWTNNSTISGWYAAQELGTMAGIGPTTGSGSTYALKSYGASGDTERSLGSMAGDATGRYFYGVRLINNTDEIITELDISYYGETWRQGSSATPEYQKLLFSYSLNATGISDTQFGTSYAASDLDYTSDVPTIAPSSSSSSRAVNGNDNALYVGSILTLASGWNPGTELWLRWTDLNNSGYDSGLGIDDLFVATYATVPEPGTIGLMVLGSLWTLFFWRRRSVAARR